MLQQGFNPDMPDYDGRTALMLAAVKGHADVVDLLLLAGERGAALCRRARGGGAGQGMLAVCVGRPAAVGG
jgi:ankyrin repeat protein